MANITADRKLDTRPRGREGYTLTDATTFYVGSLVGVASTGYLVKHSDTAGYEFAGLLEAGTREAGKAIVGDTSATPSATGHVDETGPTLQNVPVASVAQTNVGDLVYCTTDNVDDLQLTATTNVGAVGYVKRFISAGRADVGIFTPQEHLALN